MKTRKQKKGFTIVELVIVLAVVGVLAAILIPTFTNIINKANTAKDQSLVYNLNEALILEEIDHNGKYDTMHDTLTAMDKKQGFGVNRIKVTSKNSEILWDSVNNRFVMVTKNGNTDPTYYNGTDKIDYPNSTVKEVDLWRISDTVDENSPYSTYYTGSAESVETSKGFDAGNSNVTTINYKNTDSTQNVVVRTNSFATTLNINAPEDTVRHYGCAASVNVKNIKDESYDEYGTVGRIKVEKGHVEMMPESEVFCLMEAPVSENAVKTTTVNQGATIHKESTNLKAEEGVEKNDSTGVANGHVDDCGAGKHVFSSVVFDGENFYDVCECCGYTLICVKDNNNNEVKQTKNTIDAETGEVIENPTVIQTYIISVDLTAVTPDASDNIDISNATVTEEYNPGVTGGDVECSHEFVTSVLYQPTCTSTGMKQIKCTKCGAQTNALMPMVAHKYYDNIGHEHTEDEKCSVCGHVRGNKEIAKAYVNGELRVYATLTAAIADAPTDGSEFKITMLADDAAYLTNSAYLGTTFRENIGWGAWHILAGQNIIIDLNGYTLKNLIGFKGSNNQPASNNGVFNVSSGATLTIKDSSCVASSFDGTGKVFNQLKEGIPATTWTGVAAESVNRMDVVILNTGTFILESGTLDCRVDGQITYAIDSCTTSSVTINGGMIKAIHTVCRIRKGNATFTNAYVKAGGSTAIYTQTSQGAVNITINSGYYDGDIYDNDGSNFTLTINGGTFEYLYYFGYIRSGKTNVNYIVKGGTFVNMDVSGYCDDTHFTKYNNEDNMYHYSQVTEDDAVCKVDNIYYANVDKAIKNVEENGTITLLDNISVGQVNATNGKTFTLDLNGKTITSDWGIVIKNTTNITVKNGTIIGKYCALNPCESGNTVILESIIASATNKYSDSYPVGAAISCDDGGETITIKSGNYSGVNTAYWSAGTDTIVIQGGTFDCDPTAYVDSENYNVTNNGNVWEVTAK